jgi:integrase
MPITRKNHYQEGSLVRVPRAKGPDVWVYRWREKRPDGCRVQIKRVIGPVDRYPTEASAKRAVEQLRIEINAERELIGKITIAEAWEHFQAHELNDADVDRSPTTIALYHSNFRVHIIPRWGWHLSYRCKGSTCRSVAERTRNGSIDEVQAAEPSLSAFLSQHPS